MSAYPLVLERQTPEGFLISHRTLTREELERVKEAWSKVVTSEDREKVAAEFEMRYVPVKAE